MCTDTITNIKRILKITKRKLVSKIAEVLEDQIQKNKKRNLKKSNIPDQSPFNSSIPPTLSLAEFLVRLSTGTNIEESTLILAFIYLTRLITEAEVLLTDYNVYK
jgi:hypothetical protein